MKFNFSNMDGSITASGQCLNPDELANIATEFNAFCAMVNKFRESKIALGITNTANPALPTIR